MVHKYGDTVTVDDVYGVVVEHKGKNLKILVLERADLKLVASSGYYASKNKPTEFSLSNEAIDGGFYCNSALVGGKEVPIKWSKPSDILDKMLPEGPATPSHKKGIETPTTERRRSRRIAMAPRSLFNEDDSSDGRSIDLDSSSDEFDSQDDEEDEKVITPRLSPVKKIAPKPVSSPRKARSPKKATSKQTTTKAEGNDSPSIPSTPRKRKANNLEPRTPKRARATDSTGGDDLYRSLPSTPHKVVPETPRTKARNSLHIAHIPESLPCRDAQFSQLFRALEHAVQTSSGTCIYISGTPGTGKSSTVREVVEQLTLRKEDNELPDFDFLEINGMRLTHATLAYDLLYHHIYKSTDRASTKNAMIALQALFDDKNNKLKPLIVLMDELDQLMTKDQSVIYNFFNWPSLPHSHLIVIAVANTLDMPERMLQTKIKSRLGLTKIQFPGYTHGELQRILKARLEEEEVVHDDAIEYVSRKVGGVSGDARRALDICRRAVELTPDGDAVTVSQVHRAIQGSQSSHIGPILASLSLCTKLFLFALLQYSKRMGTDSFPVNGIMQQCRELIQTTSGLEKYDHLLFMGGQVRLQGYQHALTELVEGGVISQEIVLGDTSANIRLNIDLEGTREALATEDIKDIFK